MADVLTGSGVSKGLFEGDAPSSYLDEESPFPSKQPFYNPSGFDFWSNEL